MKRLAALSLAAASLLLADSRASATVVTTIGDGTAGGATMDNVISPNEYGPGNSYSFTGGGSGFGGTVGNGTLYMESDATNLYVGFQPGASLNDNVVIHLDTKAGGFTDATMSDTTDPGRNLLTNLTRDVDDPFPAGILPDYGMVFFQNGEVSFELTGGSLTFIGPFDGANSQVREMAIPLSTIGNPSAISFFVSYGSNTNFMSNESIPAEAFNALGNPGFDNASNGGVPVIHANYDQFLVPEPASLGLISLSGLFMRRCRRR
jgi:hypothetical protein